MEAGKPFYALITPLEKEFSPVRPGQPGVPSHPIALRRERRNTPS